MFTVLVLVSNQCFGYPRLKQLSCYLKCSGLLNHVSENITSLQEINTNYARAYDLSRSEPDRICKLASQMILGGVSVETVNELFLLAARQTPQNGRVGKALKETFEQVLGCLR